jgi:O-antigen ligase
MEQRQLSSHATSGFNAAQLSWVAMFCSILIWGFGQTQAGTIGNAGNWYRIGLVFLAGGIALFALLRNASRLPNAFAAPLLLFLVYGIVAMISSLYIPAYSFYSMWKGFEIVVDVLTVVAILAYLHPYRAARLAYVIIVGAFRVLIVIALVEALVVPSGAFQPSRGLFPYMLHGVLPLMSENGLAFISAVVAYASWCDLFVPGKRVLRKLLRMLFLCLGLLTLVLTQSRTSLIGLAVATSVFLLFDRRFGWLTCILVAAGAAAALTSLVDVSQQFIMRGQSRELFESLSGRVQGWQAAWALFKLSPVIGHGFAASARVDILGPAGASTLHGAVFDVMVGVGLLGLLPWTLGVLLTGLQLVAFTFSSKLRGRANAMYTTRHAEMLGLLTLIVIRSATSSGLAMHDHTFMLFLAIVAYTAAARNAPVIAASGEPRQRTVPHARPQVAAFRR